MSNQAQKLPWTLELGPMLDYAHTASDRKTLKRLAKAPSAQPQSRFLQLSGEIRNAIYADVAKDTPILTTKETRVKAPALGRVCRQIEAEYSGVFTELAPRYANEVKIHINNGSDWTVKWILDNLDAVVDQSNGGMTNRLYTIVLSVTSGHYTRCYYWLDYCNKPNVKTEIRFDAAVLDDTFFAQKMRLNMFSIEIGDAYFVAQDARAKARQLVAGKRRKSEKGKGGSKRLRRS